MNIRLLILVLLLSTTFQGIAFPQQYLSKKVIEGQTIDKKTSAEIPFVNIYFQKSLKGTSSDAAGNFRLDIEKYQTSDTILFSSIGY